MLVVERLDKTEKSKEEKYKYPEAYQPEISSGRHSLLTDLTDIPTLSPLPLPTQETGKLDTHSQGPCPWGQPQDTVLVRRPQEFAGAPWQAPDVSDEGDRRRRPGAAPFLFPVSHADLMLGAGAAIF